MNLINNTKFFLFFIVLQSCNKSVLDLDDNTSSIPKQFNDTIIQNLTISNRLPKVMYEYPTFSTDSTYKRKINFEYDQSTHNITKMINENEITNFSYSDSSIKIKLMNNQITLLLSNNRVIQKTIGGPFTYTYNENGYLIEVDCSQWNENYYYINGDLIQRNTYIKGSPSYSYSSYFEYYDSIYFGISSYYTEFSVIDYFKSGIDNYRFLNIFGNRNLHLLKTLKLYSPINIDTITYTYEWQFDKDMIKKVDVWSDSAIIRRGVVESYY